MNFNIYKQQKCCQIICFTTFLLYLCAVKMIMQIYNKMLKVSKKIRDKILEDKEFSSKVALLLGIKQVSAELLARRNSRSLTLHILVEFYKREGFTEDEIFEKSK